MTDSNDTKNSKETLIIQQKVYDMIMYAYPAIRLRRAFSRLHSITPVPSPMLTLVSAPLYPRVRCRSPTGQRSAQGYKGVHFHTGLTRQKIKPP